MATGAAARHCLGPRRLRSNVARRYDNAHSVFVRDSRARHQGLEIEGREPAPRARGTDPASRRHWPVDREFPTLPAALRGILTLE